MPPRDFKTVRISHFVNTDDCLTIETCLAEPCSITSRRLCPSRRPQSTQRPTLRQPIRHGDSRQEPMLCRGPAALVIAKAARQTSLACALTKVPIGETAHPLFSSANQPPRSTKSVLHKSRVYAPSCMCTLNHLSNDCRGNRTSSLDAMLTCMSVFYYCFSSPTWDAGKSGSASVRGSLYPFGHKVEWHKPSPHPHRLWRL